MTCKFGFQCVSSDIQTRQQQLPSSLRAQLKYGLKRQENLKFGLTIATIQTL